MASPLVKRIGIIFEDNHKKMVCVNFDTNFNSFKKIVDLVGDYSSNPSWGLAGAEFSSQAIGQTLELVICEK